jgi:hypothetical protein
MEKEKDDIICICSIENTGHTIGVRVPCRGDDCKNTVWLSDSTINTIKQQNPGINLSENPPSPVCMECGLKIMSKSKDFKMSPMSSEQAKELMEAVINIDAQQG